MAVNDEGLVLFSGYAKLPVGITASEMYKVIGVILVIRVETGEIVEADCTLATNVAREYVARILTGQSLKHGPDGVLRNVDKRYQGSAKKAIMTSLRIIYDKYRSFMEEQIAPDSDIQ
ncbi:MAG TPA: DUF3870 domain-containing protein [Negativicutes bacterium]|nr:DUF3870 domain-containing protein [Negativicutes bacterium]